MSQKLFVAIYENKPEIALKLLENKKIHSNINATFRAFGLHKPYTCLYWACGNDDHVEVVRELLTIKNVDVNKGDDEDRDTPLHMAADNGSLKCARLLCCYDVKVMANSWGLTPYHCAVSNGHSEVLELLLLQDKTLLNSKTKTNEIATPLHVAAMFGHIECVRVLLRYGAQVDAKDADKRTPANLALDNKHNDISIILSQLETCSFLSVDQIEHHIQVAQEHLREPTTSTIATEAALSTIPREPSPYSVPDDIGESITARMLNFGNQFYGMESQFGFPNIDDDSNDERDHTENEKEDDKATEREGATGEAVDEKAKAMAGKVRRNFINLKESLKAEDHLEFLYEHNILSAEEIELILSKSDQINKAREMVFCMLKKPSPEWVYTFLESLQQVPSSSHWVHIISNP